MFASYSLSQNVFLKSSAHNANQNFFGVFNIRKAFVFQLILISVKINQKVIEESLNYQCVNISNL